MDFLSRIVKGLVVGVANIIPGVSGGTMAVFKMCIRDSF